MFEFIIGEIRKINEDYVILENHGMGYKIFTTEKAVEVVKLYEEYTFYISMQIRENEVYLYGFLDENELYLFNLLITVSGVGPKSGLSLLSVMNIYQIKQAVLMNDSNSLSKANGIGKKTAGRIILELQDKIINMDDDLIIGTQKELSVSENMLLAIDALQNLGFMRRDIEKVLMNVNVNAMEIEEIIKLCLKKLS
ncbi:Holliday junction DNA helicase RuvA [Peptostreptococcaceae bacterium oral taxon 113 str. W5053]|nr:Holliday junction DNA helicase RuvA [Peptostreptococcaceae bacterium oral taxon 113 str. W5053]